MLPQALPTTRAYQDQRLGAKYTTDGLPSNWRINKFAVHDMHVPGMRIPPEEIIPPCHSNLPISSED